MTSTTKDRRGPDRRVTDPRKAVRLDGPDRRQGERRSGRDRRSHPRET